MYRSGDMTFAKSISNSKLYQSIFPSVPRMALTATATERTRNEIIDRLELRNVAKFVHGFDRPNIRYSVEVKGSGNAQLIDFLNAHRGESGIVYCLSRRGAQDMAQTLCDLGYDALPYHAGMDSNVRAENQARFLRDDGVVMVATIAFGMGIDKPDVRFIAHINLPQSIEGYYQETGRAGRDGRSRRGIHDIWIARHVSSTQYGGAVRWRRASQKNTERQDLFPACLVRTGNLSPGGAAELLWRQFSFRMRKL